MGRPFSCSEKGSDEPVHLVMLATRTGLFFLSLFSWCIWLNRKFEIQAEQTPVIAACGMSVVLYFAALLNVIFPVQMMLYLAGPLLAAFCVKKEREKAIRPFLTLGFIAFGILILWTLLLERGRVIDGHDNLAHWAIMAKRIMTDGQLPNTANLSVEYVDYPPATALWITLVCRAIGFSDGSMVFAQSVLSIACMMSFVPLCRKKWYGAAAVVGFCLYMGGLSTAYRDLRVDGLLTLLCVAVIAVVLAHKEKPRTAFGAALPVLCFLAITKNSGLFFVAASALSLLAVFVQGPGTAKKKLKMIVFAMGIPTLCWWLWSRHVQLVYPAGKQTKHAVSLHAYESLMNSKTPQEMSKFNQAFIGYYTEWSNMRVMSFWLILLVFLLVCVYLFCTKAFTKKQAIGWAVGGVGLTAAYLAALWCTYVFSMPTKEMLVLASIPRYTASFFDGLLGCSILLLLSYGVKRSIKGTAVICSGLMLLQVCAIVQFGNWQFIKTSAAQWAPNARQQLWLHQKEIYPIQDGARYLVYTNGGPMDSWGDRFVGRYALNTDVLDFWQYKKSAPPMQTIRQYDYILFLEPDEYSRTLLESWGFDPNTPIIETKLFSARQDELVTQGLPLPDMGKSDCE